MDHFYDGQIRRYITQLVRLMSNFSYKDGKGKLTQIPVSYGDLTRQVANIIRDNSENKIPSAPRMAVYVTGLEMDRTRNADFSYVSKMNLREREFDEDTQEYLNFSGKQYTVERLMPSPYILRANVDIWASNTEQKLQIMEQILMLFNPSLEIQTTDNYVDWTSLSVVNLDNINWSNRSVPVGVDSEIDISTLTFSTPIWVSPPAKVKRLGVITNIITSLFDEATGSISLGDSTPQILQWQDSEIQFEARNKLVSEDGELETVVDYGQFPNDGSGVMDIETDYSITQKPLGNRVSLSVTLGQYGVLVQTNKGYIIDKNSVGEVSWRALLDAYPGCYKSDQTTIRFKTANGGYIIGTITINPLNETEIFINWDLDTLPDDTVLEGPARSSSSYSSLDYIIDPLRWNPNQEKTAGLRLLMLGKIGSVDNTDGADGWKNNDGTEFIADENDIVEWDGTKWHIIFDASENTDPIYITNLNTSAQYKWTGEYWIRSYEGEYSGGTWMIYPP